MGLLARSVKTAIPMMREAASTIPFFQNGTAQLPGSSYQVFAREGYQRNEIVFACIEQLATSAAEPRLVGRKWSSRGPLTIVDHDMIRLLNRPNPFLTRFQLWATVIMHLYLAGNAYIEIVRGRNDKPVELWIMRPDRVRVVPDLEKYIGGYTYTIGAEKIPLPARDVIHFKMRHPLDDFYGMPPLMAASGRIDIDNYMRDFAKAFFQNAGVPAGLLSVKQKLSGDAKKDIKGRFRNEFGGPRGWHDLLVLDQAEATFTPLTMGPGARGLAVSDLDEIVEARTTMIFGVPLTLIGARLGMASSSYANRKSDREMFWDMTLHPLYKQLAETLDTFLVPEYPDLDEAVFDLSDVKALAEDVDKVLDRERKNYEAGASTWEEFRTISGKDPDVREGHLLIPNHKIVVNVPTFLDTPELIGAPVPAAPGAPAAEPAPEGAPA